VETGIGQVVDDYGAKVSSGLRYRRLAMHEVYGLGNSLTPAAVTFLILDMLT
jgi:hypothetical protein